MKIKIITIKGKPTRCRVLEKTEKVCFGDVFEDGSDYPKSNKSVMGKPVGKAIFLYPLYRPLKSKPRAAKVGKGKGKIKSATAWARVSNGAIIPGSVRALRRQVWAIYGNGGDVGFSAIIPVTITYRKKGK